MYAIAKFDKYKIEDGKTVLLVTLTDEKVCKMIADKAIHHAEMRFDDGRTITAEQRRKAYALINAISDFTGYSPEETKSVFKVMYYAQTGEEHLSLKDCTVTEARLFINILMDYCITEGVQLREPAVNLAEDVSRYLYACLKNRRCAICGKSPADIHHHEKKVGMGNDRNKIDDSNYPKIALCRQHHILAHTMNTEQFNSIYHLYGICAKDVEGTDEDENWVENSEE